MDKRKKKLAINTLASIVNQVVVLICGFITPRLILGAFGTDVNGLVISVSQFLGVVSLLDLGVGTVVQSALYKPLAENDIDSVSRIYVSATRFFKRLAMILLAYVIVLLFIYPTFINRQFDFGFTATLIGAICISSFAQYYFGIVNGLLLSADQKGYIQYTSQIVTLIINTAACAVMIHLGASIQVVKLTTSVIYLGRPLILSMYVRAKYPINRKITYTEEPIKQKWNGMAQHFASFVLTGTDNIVLTIFSTLANVSIYYVYNLVVTGIYNLFCAMTNGYFPYFGDIWARNERDTLEREFSFFEWLVHNCTVLIFGCTGILIINFVRVYTKNIMDADYVQPLFSLILVLAYAMRALRLPYNYLILAAGHYKQTQSNYIIAMLMNIIISIITVYRFGLVGVAIGTFAAMFYQTIWMAWYDYKTFIQSGMSRFFKSLGSDIIIAIIGICVTIRIPIRAISYLAWIEQAVVVFLIWVMIVSVLNIIFHKDYSKRAIRLFLKKIGR